MTDIHHPSERAGEDSHYGDHGTEEAPSPSSFTPEFKAEIVKRCRVGDRTIGQVARDVDLTETAVQSWVHQAEVDAGERDGLTTEECQELNRLRRENRRLQG